MEKNTMRKDYSKHTLVEQKGITAEDVIKVNKPLIFAWFQDNTAYFVEIALEDLPSYHPVDYNFVGIESFDIFLDDVLVAIPANVIDELIEEIREKP